MVEVFASKALICVLGQCFAALVGDSTPPGTYPIQRAIVAYADRREDVLVFAYDEDGRAFAIHRPPSPRRRALLARNAAEKVTAGCVNVDDAVFDYLVSCCSGSRLTIHP